MYIVHTRACLCLCVYIPLHYSLMMTSEHETCRYLTLTSLSCIIYYVKADKH